MEHLDQAEVDEQLHAELNASLARSLAAKQPVLTHLNADTTWLLSIPTGTAGKSSRRPRSHSRSRHFFHILIDPWLKGPQADVTRFLSQQWHKEESAVQTISEVEGIIADLERAVSTHLEPEPSSPRSSRSGSEIDLVIVSHEFTDHMHRDTLFEIHPDVPVFATSVAAGRIRAWNHFAMVVDMPRFQGVGKDWRSHSVHPLPPWLSVMKLDSSQTDLLNYHSAVMVSFCRPSEVEATKATARSILYTPHGISPEQLSPVSGANPPIQTLALIHTMHNIRLSGAQLNLGAHNGLKAQRLIRAKYWVGTHDEEKTGFGIVSWILKRKVISIEEALRMEIQENSGAGDDAEDECRALEKVQFVHLGNGETLILE